MSFLAANQVVESCASTNDLARQLGEQGAPHGSWISARAQEQGRGRLGRQWQSLSGNLFFSLVARIEDKSRWSWVPLATAVAVARMISACYPELAGRVRIKWPNDLWIVPPEAPPGAAGAKLGGILCEAVGQRSGSFIVIGLGLNCAASPEGIDQAAVSLTQILNKKISADDIRPGIIDALMLVLEDLANCLDNGSAGIVRDFERFAAFPPGSRVEWSAPGDAREVFAGEVRGLGPSGELLVKTSVGEELRLYAEDVRVRSRPTKASDGSPA